MPVFYLKCDGKPPACLRGGQDLMESNGGFEKTLASVKMWQQGDPL